MGNAVFFFFWAWKKSQAWNRFFGFFSFFSRAKFGFHACVLPGFWLFSRQWFVFTPNFGDFFHGQKNGFTGKNMRIFTGSIFFSRALFEHSRHIATRSPEPSSPKEKGNIVGILQNRAIPYPNSLKSQPLSPLPPAHRTKGVQVSAISTS